MGVQITCVKFNTVPAKRLGKLPLVTGSRIIQGAAENAAAQYIAVNMTVMDIRGL
jgi:hypothetical protein